VAKRRLVTVSFAEGCSNMNTAKLLINVVERAVEVICDESLTRPEKREVNRLTADNALIHQLTKWRTNVPFTEGLRETAKCIERNLHLFDLKTYAR
jgi:hypothetical protein